MSSCASHQGDPATRTHFNRVLGEYGWFTRYAGLGDD